MTENPEWTRIWEELWANFERRDGSASGVDVLTVIFKEDDYSETGKSDGALGQRGAVFG